MKKQNVRTLSLIVCTFTYLLIGAASRGKPAGVPDRIYQLFPVLRTMRQRRGSSSNSGPRREPTSSRPSAPMPSLVIHLIAAVAAAAPAGQSGTATFGQVASPAVASPALASPVVVPAANPADPASSTPAWAFGLLLGCAVAMLGVVGFRRARVRS